MKLQEIFDQLGTGEFSQISLGGQLPGVINELNRAKVMNHINLGLTALYTRFTLKESRIKLNLQANVDTYPITSNFSVNSRRARAEIRYLLDTPAQPFDDDILKIVRVETDDGVELDLNNHSNTLSVFTPTAAILRVPMGMVNGDRSIPESLKTVNLLLSYRAAHRKIVEGVGYFDPSRYEVELPDSHLEALLWFVASRAHNPIGMGQEFNAGNTYYAKYENACAQLEATGMEVDQGSENYRLQRNGWV